MRRFEIRRRNVLLKHALRLHSDKKHILIPLTHVPWRAVPGLSRRFFGSAKEFVCSSLTLVKSYAILAKLVYLFLLVPGLLVKSSDWKTSDD
jgi:hypothetical protein